MKPLTVGFESNDGRSLELTVGKRCATAQIGDAEPFPFNVEHLDCVDKGMAYQAWGNGSHMVLRRVRGTIMVEFQGPDDRGVARCLLTEDEFRSRVGALDPLFVLENLTTAR